ncbi:hypothetical protein HK104_011038 [Borealophlyctis nickersoniae]|nr:hypothetical protein HK104_011038 [Borealophlyctis nickersoniae]
MLRNKNRNIARALIDKEVGFLIDGKATTANQVPDYTALLVPLSELRKFPDALWNLKDPGVHVGRSIPHIAEEGRKDNGRLGTLAEVGYGSANGIYPATAGVFNVEKIAKSKYKGHYKTFLAAVKQESRKALWDCHNLRAGNRGHFRQANFSHLTVSGTVICVEVIVVFIIMQRSSRTPPKVVADARNSQVIVKTILFLGERNDVQDDMMNM